MPGQHIESPKKLFEWIIIMLDDFTNSIAPTPYFVSLAEP
jgi:hypothetical protein